VVITLPLIRWALVEWLVVKQLVIVVA